MPLATSRSCRRRRGWSDEDAGKSPFGYLVSVRWLAASSASSAPLAPGPLGIEGRPTAMLIRVHRLGSREVLGEVSKNTVAVLDNVWILPNMTRPVAWLAALEW
jgi:hypothetical protein